MSTTTRPSRIRTRLGYIGSTLALSVLSLTTATVAYAAPTPTPAPNDPTLPDLPSGNGSNPISALFSRMKPSLDTIAPGLYNIVLVVLSALWFIAVVRCAADVFFGFMKGAHKSAAGANTGKVLEARGDAWGGAIGIVLLALVGYGLALAWRVGSGIS